MDRNALPGNESVYIDLSLSARRAWIEIPIGSKARIGYRVALRKESVDRNTGNGCRDRQRQKVALRKESVDRNDVRL